MKNRTVASWFLSMALMLGLSAFGAEDVVETNFEIGGQKLKVAKTLKEAGQSLSLTGYGVRKKKVVLVKVSVYVASHYVSNPTGWSASDPTNSLKKQPRRALTLDFMRDVPGEKIKGAFEESLKENGLDPARKDLATLLNGLAVDMKEGQKMTLSGVIDSVKGEQTLIARGPKGAVEVKSPNVVDDMWSIWFGKPADGGLEELKGELSQLKAQN